MTLESADHVRTSCRGLFAGHPVLGFLTSQELDRVLGFTIMQHYSVGEVIFRKGDPGESMMMIAKGRVKISVSGSDGKEAVLAVLGASEILGEMAILDSKPRSADATAIAPSELLILHQRDFLPFLERNPGMAVRLLRLICDRLRRTNALVEDRLLRNLAARLAKSLLDLCRSERDSCAPGTRVEVPIPQRTFASLLGASRETLNKQLHAWHSAGLISLDKGFVTIQQPEELARIADPLSTAGPS